MSNYCPSNWNPYDELEECPTCGLGEYDWGEYDEDTCVILDRQGDKYYCSPRCKGIALAGAVWDGSDCEPSLIWLDTGEPVSDPYGTLDWCIGDDQDFICLEVVSLGDWLVLHAVVNSETGGFIDQFSYEIIEYDEQSIGWDIADLVGRCYTWCLENEVEVAQEGIDKGAMVVVDLIRDRNPDVNF